MQGRFIALSGVARVGKDTFCDLLLKKIEEMGGSGKRFALANELKMGLDQFLIENVGISAFTTNDEEKKIIRPLLVAYGKAKRTQSLGKYWTGRLTDPVNDFAVLGGIPIVTDVRYDEYEEDEASWVKKNGGMLIHLSRALEDGSMVPPPNEEERLNDPRIEAKSDIKLKLPTVEDTLLLAPYVDVVINAFFSKRNGAQN